MTFMLYSINNKPPVPPS